MGNVGLSQEKEPLVGTMIGGLLQYSELHVTVGGAAYEIGLWNATNLGIAARQLQKAICHTESN